MENIDIINNFIKIFYITLMSYLVYVKVSNYEDNSILKITIIILESIVVASLYIFFTKFLYPIGVVVIIYSIYGVAMNIIVKNNTNNFIVTYVLSVVITYVIYLISIIVVGILLSLFRQYIAYNGIVALLFIIILASSLCYFILKMKRIRKGFNFLNKIKIDKKIVFSILLFAGIILIFFGLLQETNNSTKNTWLFTGSILIIISLIIWTQNQITKQYKRNMRDRTIEIQTKEIVEQSKIIKEIKEENLKLAETIHKYNNRLSALELGIANALKNNNKTEFANELGLMLEETKELLKNFAEETTINKTNLPKTNIIGLDNMFKYFQNEANKNNIDFNVIINENIEDLLKIIDKPKLETLIGDHLKDAIIAVNKSKNPYKSILVILGISNKCYEISICDSGIEFEIDTLLKLGKERVTTHKEEGGSGIGFITTFKTLKETKASLEIEEYNPRTTNYTKSIVIRFDGKNEYRIYSYRAEEIKKKNNEKRIIIEEL